MQIGEVIRTYRKQKALTQEEMAKRLGVTAPAVNKWESGASLPDVLMLAPIARLLDITPDTLLSFEEELTQEEINEIVREVDEMFRGGKSYQEAFQFVKKKIGQYPNSERLIGQLAMAADGWRILQGIKDTEQAEEYDKTIRGWYETALKSNDEEVRERAADSLFSYYYRNGDYDQAEKYLDHFSRKDPVKKLHKAMLYRYRKQPQEAYREYEELMFQCHNVLQIVLGGIQTWAIEDKDMEKAESITEKLVGLEQLFEMGDYYVSAAGLDLALAKKDTQRAVEYMRRLLDSAEELDAYTASSLYEHMEFKPLSPEFREHLGTTIRKAFREREECAFLREDEGWRALVEIHN